MNANSTPHTSSWISFTYASFIIALIMVAVGIVIFLSICGSNLTLQWVLSCWFNRPSP